MMRTAPSSAPIPSAAVINVLLVEDDPVFAAVITAKLSTAGQGSVHLEHVDNIADACSRLAMKGTDVVMLDLHLPDSSGMETVVAIRKANPHVPIVVMTSGTDSDLATEALAQGAQDYLVKGQDKDRHILRALRFAVERNKNDRRLRISEERFRDFAEVAADWFWETDSFHNFSWISESVAELLGIDPVAVVGQPRSCLMNEERARQFDQIMATQKAFAHFTYEYYVGGACKYLRISGKPVFSRSGRFLGYRGIGSNFTREFESQHFAARMLGILTDAMDAFPGGFMVFDNQDRLLVSSEKVAGFLPDAADLLVAGTSFLDIMAGVAARGHFTAAQGRQDEWLAEWRDSKVQSEEPLAEPTAFGVRCFIHQYPTTSGGTLRIIRYERGVPMARE